MTRLVTIEQLLEKPVCMMSGEEFVLLLQNAEKGTGKAPAEVVPERHYEHGIAGIAKIFGCSIPTANRIKIRLYLERLVPKAYDTWSIPMRAAYQKGAYTEATPNSKPEVLLNMVCARQIIEELPNDLVRRNPAKYTTQYINRLMSLCPKYTCQKRKLWSIG